MRTANCVLKFVPIASLNNHFKRLCVSYAKDEGVMKNLERWFEDIQNLIKCAYLAVDQMRVHLPLSRSAGKSSSSKIWA
jgi:hypothetical protein